LASSSRSSASWLTLLAILSLYPGAAPAEELEFERLTGGREVIALEKAAPLLLHFWATWCPECVEELSSLASAAKACVGSPARIALVNVGESVAEINEFLAAHPVALEQLRDPRGRVWRRISGVGLPLNLTWDGQKKSVSVGPRNPEAWLAELSRLGCRIPAEDSRD
jgi:thiol-disulfide isomerase/thioredoxin